MTEEHKVDLIRAHFEELSAKYTDLVLVPPSDDSRIYVVRGMLRFTVAYEGEPEKIECGYQIDLVLSPEYPERHPVVIEVGGRVDKDFHTNSNGSLCLGAPLAVRKTFANRPTLIGFVEDCVVPFFYSYEFKKKYGKLPFGELSHGDLGIVENYRDIFDVKDDFGVLGLVKILADNCYRGHLTCPCGSGHKLRHCHGSQLRNLIQYQSQNEFLMDYVIVLTSILKSGRPIPKMLLSKIVAKNVELPELEKKGLFV